MQDAGIMQNQPQNPPQQHYTSIKNTGNNIPRSNESSLMNKKRIDLIFCSVNKHKPNMSFDIFLQALIKIAEFKYLKGFTPTEALKSLI